jgi:transposase-like protein
METKRVARRKHSAEFRAEVVLACRQPSASVAAIALRKGLNANVVYRWLREDC